MKKIYTDTKKKKKMWTVGYRNLNKVNVPHIIPMAKGSIIVLRRLHPQIVRPRQLHVTIEGHTIEKKFRRRC